MFYKMRRNKQETTIEEAEAMLKRATSGVLAVIDQNNDPYAVPLSFAYEKDTLYFHCATTGHKLDAIRSHEKVSFCVIDTDQIVPEKYTTKYASAIAFGKASMVENEEEKRHALRLLAQKYSPNETEEQTEKEIGQSFAHVGILKVQIERLTGKKAKELC